MSLILDPEAAEAMAPMGEAMAGMTPPVVGDVGGRRAMWKPILDASGKAQPIPEDVTTHDYVPFSITKQAVSRHIHVLETAGLITRSRDAQRRPCHLNAAGLEELTGWIDTYRLLAEQRHRRMDAVLENMKEQDK